jgi:SAM-dependent methyltransferase
MPTSDPIFLTPVAQTICNLNPKRVLDVGIGTGKWGALIREYTDIWNQKDYYEGINPRIYLAGIEIRKMYNNTLWKLYDRVMFGDASEVVKELDIFKKFDLVLMIDSIEHIDKQKALQLLINLREISTKIIVSYSNLEQEGTELNPYEAHISTWGSADFSHPTWSMKVLLNNPNYGLLLLENPI